MEVATALKHGDWSKALKMDSALATGGVQHTARNEMNQIAAAFTAAAHALRAREQSQSAHSAVARATAASLDKRQIGAEALSTVVHHVSADLGALYHIGRSAQLEPVASYALKQNLANIPLGEGVVGQAASSGRAVIVRDVPSDTPFRVRLGFDEAPARTIAAVPILFRAEPIGVLLVASLREFSPDCLQFLDVAATQIGIGLRNAAAFEENERLLGEVRDKNERIVAQSQELQSQNEEIQAQIEEIRAQGEEIQAQSEELHAQNDDLKRRSESIRAQAALLEDADRRKDEFIGLLAHELRNPLAPINNCLHLLTRAAPGSENYQLMRDVLTRQMRHMTRLIDDLLDLTRITRGKVIVRRERLDLTRVVHDCIEDQPCGYRAGAM